MGPSFLTGFQILVSLLTVDLCILYWSVRVRVRVFGVDLRVLKCSMFPFIVVVQTPKGLFAAVAVNQGTSRQSRGHTRTERHKAPPEPLASDSCAHWRLRGYNPKPKVSDAVRFVHDIC